MLNQPTLDDILRQISNLIQATATSLPDAQFPIFNQLACQYSAKYTHPSIDFSKVEEDMSSKLLCVSQCQSYMDKLATQIEEAKSHDVPIDERQLPVIEQNLNAIGLRVLSIIRYVRTLRSMQAITDTSGAITTTQGFCDINETLNAIEHDIALLKPQLTGSDIQILEAWLSFDRGLVMLRYRMLLDTATKKTIKINPPHLHWQYLQNIRKLPPKEFPIHPSILYKTLYNSLVITVKDEKDPDKQKDYVQPLIDTCCTMIGADCEHQGDKLKIWIIAILLNETVPNFTAPTQRALFLMRIKTSDINDITKRAFVQYAVELGLATVPDYAKKNAGAIIRGERTGQQTAQTKKAAPTTLEQDKAAASAAAAMAEKLIAEEEEEKKKLKQKSRQTEKEKQSKHKKPRPKRQAADVPSEPSGKARASKKGFSSTKQQKHPAHSDEDLFPQRTQEAATSQDDYETTHTDESYCIPKDKSRRSTALKPTSAKNEHNSPAASKTTSSASRSTSLANPSASSSTRPKPQPALTPPATVTIPSTITLSKLRTTKDNDVILQDTIVKINIIMDFIKGLLERFPGCEINLSGGYARNLLIAHHRLSYKMNIPADLDLEIVLPASRVSEDEIAKYLADHLRLSQHRLVKPSRSIPGLYSYNPTPLSEDNPLPFSVDFKIIATKQKETKPCFLIDALKISLPYLTCDFPLPQETSNWLTQIWHPSSSAVPPNPGPTMDNLIFDNPKTLFRILRIAFTHGLPQDLYKPLTRALQVAANGQALIGALNFHEFKSELGKFFMRGYIGPLTTDHRQSNIRNALFSVLRPLFPDFYKRMTDVWLSSLQQHFMVDCLKEVDTIASDKVLGRHPSICAIFALLLIPKYFEHPRLPDKSTIRENFIALGEYFKDKEKAKIDIREWLAKYEGKALKQIDEFLCRYHQKMILQQKQPPQIDPEAFKTLTALLSSSEQAAPPATPYPLTAPSSVAPHAVQFRPLDALVAASQQTPTAAPPQQK